jgi:hypothetical protein
MATVLAEDFGAAQRVKTDSVRNNAALVTIIISHFRLPEYWVGWQ